MGAVEKIVILEEQVSGLQSQPGTVETVLEKAEQVAVTGEKAGRCLRRSLRVLLALSVIAIIVLIVKKVMGDGCPFGNKTADDVESTPEAVDADTSDDASADDEATPDGDADAS